MYKSSYQKSHNDNLNKVKLEPLNRFYYKKENLTKAMVTYVPKNYHNVSYETLKAEKSKNLYNSTQLVKLAPEN